MIRIFNSDLPASGNAVGLQNTVSLTFLADLSRVGGGGSMSGNTYRLLLSMNRRSSAGLIDMASLRFVPVTFYSVLVRFVPVVRGTF